MSVLLYWFAKLIFFCVLAVAVLTLLTWLTKSPKSEQSTHPIEEWPEDKATYMDRISMRRGAAPRRDARDEHERRRA